MKLGELKTERLFIIQKVGKMPYKVSLIQLFGGYGRSKSKKAENRKQVFRMVAEGLAKDNVDKIVVTKIKD